MTQFLRRLGYLGYRRGWLDQHHLRRRHQHQNIVQQFLRYFLGLDLCLACFLNHQKKTPQLLGLKHRHLSRRFPQLVDSKRRTRRESM